MLELQLCFTINITSIYVKRLKYVFIYLDRQPLELTYIASEPEGECILLKINPVSFNIIKFIIFVLAAVIFAGFPILLIFWYFLCDFRYPKLKKIFYYDFCNL
jgi:hypothetical protein